MIDGLTLGPMKALEGFASAAPSSPSLRILLFCNKQRIKIISRANKKIQAYGSEPRLSNLRI